MKALGYFALVVVILALLLALPFGLSAIGLVHFELFAPKYQAVERQVFENTPSYVQGKISHLTRLRLEYRRAETDAQKTSLKEMILTEAATVDQSKLPADLRDFIQELKR